MPRGCGTSRGQTRLREDANTSRNVAASDATTQRRRPNSQRRSVRRDYAKRRTQVATSQRQMRLREDAAQTRNVAASQRQTRQGQTRLREDVNTSRNVAASDATTRRRRPNSQRRSVAASDATEADATTRRREHKSQRRSVRRDYAKKEPKLATSQRRSAKPNGNRSCTHTELFYSLPEGRKIQGSHQRRYFSGSASWDGQELAPEAQAMETEDSSLPIPP